MRVLDTRPPFAGLANLSEAALASLPTPCYLLDEAQLRRNGEILLGVQQRTGCKMLLAQKAFSNFDLYPLLAPYLAGTEASGLYESRLGREELPQKENHVFCAAYRVDEFAELLHYADHIVFNSPAQLAKFGPAAKAAGKAFASTAVSMTREIIFGVSLPVILPVFFGLDGLLWSFPAADLLTFLIAAFFIRQTYRELSDVSAVHTEEET